jgi:hypothetical protein
MIARHARRLSRNWLGRDRNPLGRVWNKPSARALVFVSGHLQHGAVWEIPDAFRGFESTAPRLIVRSPCRHWRSVFDTRSNPLSLRESKNSVPISEQLEPGTMPSSGTLSAAHLPVPRSLVGFLSCHRSCADQLAIRDVLLGFAVLAKPSLGRPSHAARLEQARHPSGVFLASGFLPGDLVGDCPERDRLDFRAGFGAAATPYINPSRHLRSAARAASREDACLIRALSVVCAQRIITTTHHHNPRFPFRDEA